MNQTTVRQTFQYTRCPTPEQERTFAHILARCRELYNAGLQERREAWRLGGVSVSRWQHEAQLKAMRAEIPEYAAIPSHVLQDVLARLDRAFHACFRRVQVGETPGQPRFHGRVRYHSFVFKESGNGARLDNGLLVLSKSGRVAVRWSRPLEGTPKTVTLSQEADGWQGCCSCADVPPQPLPLTGQETGIDLGLEAFATLADGAQRAHPRLLRVADGSLSCTCSVPSGGQRAASRAVAVVGKRCTGSPGHTRKCGGHARTSTIRRRWRWCVRTTRSLMRTCSRPTCSSTTSSPRAAAMPGAVGSYPSGLAKQQTLGRRSSPCRRRAPRKPVRAAVCWSRRRFPSAGRRARTAGRVCIGTTTPR